MFSKLAKARIDDYKDKALMLQLIVKRRRGVGVGTPQNENVRVNEIQKQCIDTNIHWR